MQSWAARFAGILALALSVAGCNTTGQGAFGTGQTVAFESIDGPPPAVFDRMVRKLNQESEARQVPVVTREGFAPYRIRGYMAVGVRRGQSVVSWVWDVYDQQNGRTLRLSGEEKAGRAGRDAWASVNDEVLTRIARSGMEQLSVYFRSPDAGVAVAQDQTSTGPVLARNDDFHPETYGITRRPPEPSVTGAEVATSTRRPAARTGSMAQAQ